MTPCPCPPTHHRNSPHRCPSCSEPFCAEPSCARPECWDCGATLPDPDATAQGGDTPITVTLTLPASEWRRAERAMSERAYYLLGRAEAGGLDAERAGAIRADLDATLPLCDAIMTAIHAADRAGRAA